MFLRNKQIELNKLNNKAKSRMTNKPTMRLN